MRCTLLTLSTGSLTVVSFFLFLIATTLMGDGARPVPASPVTVQQPVEVDDPRPAGLEPPPAAGAAGDRFPLLVSVIMPYFETGDALQRRLGTLGEYLPQDLWQWELVVVDLGSKQDPLRSTPALADPGSVLPGLRGLVAVSLPELEDDANRVGVNFGQAINAGARHAHGQYLLTMDPWSWIDPSEVSALNDRLASLPDDYDVVDRFTRVDVRMAKNHTAQDAARRTHSGWTQFTNTYMKAKPSIMVLRRALFAELGMFDEDFTSWGWEDITFRSCSDSREIRSRTWSRRTEGGVEVVYEVPEDEAKYQAVSPMGTPSADLFKQKAARKQFCNTGETCRRCSGSAKFYDRLGGQSD